MSGERYRCDADLHLKFDAAGSETYGATVGAYEQARLVPGRRSLDAPPAGALSTLPGDHRPRASTGTPYVLGEKHQVGAIGWWLFCLVCVLVAAMALLAIGSLAAAAAVGIAHMLGGVA